MTMRRKIGGSESMHRMAENAYRTEDGNLIEKGPLRVIRRRREDNM
jgi:hypothetical protein